MNELQTFKDAVNSLSIRDKVFFMESEMLKKPQLNLELKHYFSDGVYARELYIPKDTIVVGKIHKYENLNILTKGTISVLVDDKIKTVTAPYVTVSPAGTKRIAYSHTDCIWTTILKTEEFDIERIEEHFTAKNEQEYIDFCREQEQFKLFDKGI